MPFRVAEELDRLEHAFDTVKKQLLGRLHDIARAQLFPTLPASGDDDPNQGGAAALLYSGNGGKPSGARAISSAEVDAALQGQADGAQRG